MIHSAVASRSFRCVHFAAHLSLSVLSGGAYELMTSLQSFPTSCSLPLEVHCAPKLSLASATSLIKAETQARTMEPLGKPALTAPPSLCCYTVQAHLPWLSL
eukprot:3861148-Amphidinium_carterae.1